MTPDINEFYVCLGCGKYHTAEPDAVTCCTVVQHIWECSRCGEKLPSRSKAEAHVADAHPPITEPDFAPVSFASGFGNFSTP